MRSFVLDRNENSWGGFLVDLNVRELVPLFERMHFKAKVTSYPDDPATVHEAWDDNRTIVTANDAHFVRYILEHQKRDSGKTCQDCWGLLVVPATAIGRGRLLPNIKNGVLVNGSTVPWTAAAYANLCVSLHTDGTIGVRRFRRCARCQKDFPITAGWYQRLPEIGTRAKAKPEKSKA
jgi:hypothetical protein